MKPILNPVRVRPPWLPSPWPLLLVFAALPCAPLCRAATQVSDSTFAGGSPAPQVSGALTLPKAVELASHYHPALVGSTLRSHAAELRQREAGRWPNPEVSLREDNFGGSLGSTRREASIGIGQTLDLGGEGAARREGAAAQTDLAQAALEVRRREVSQETAERFIGAWVLQERIRSLRSAEQLGERSVRLADDRLLAGAAPVTERLRAEGQLALRSVERERSERELVLARQALARQWGAVAASFDTLTLPDPIAPRVLGLLADRLLQHPENRRATAEVAAASARAHEAKAARVPDLRAEAGLRRLSEVDGTGFTIGLSVPLPLWNRQNGSLAAAETERDAARADASAIAARLDQELRQALEQVRLSVDAFAAIKSRVRPSAEKAASAVESGYRAGRLSYLDLVDGQRGLLEADVAMLDAAADAWRARARLEALVGAPLDSLGMQKEAH